MAKLDKDQDREKIEQPLFVQARALQDININGLNIKCGYPLEIPNFLVVHLLNAGFIDVTKESVDYALTQYALVKVDV